MAGVDALAVLGALDMAVAVVEPGTWRIAFENEQFFKWFPPDGEDIETLPGRLAGFKPDRAEGRMQNGRPYSFETESRSQGRSVPLRARLAALPETQGTSLVVVEVLDISSEQKVQHMLDTYSGLAERNARELQKEKERVERLLLNIMPRAVLEELTEYGTTTPQRFDDATIVILDFVGFTSMAISHDPSRIITELNDIFSAFDRIVEMFNCERLKTIGDSYIAVSGVPEGNPDHARNAARVALRMRRYLERRNEAHAQAWEARIGINTGPVLGSLVGIQKYVYDLFGPGVNLAARMEAASEPMQITCSERTYGLLRDDFLFTARGPFEIKGFGTQHLYFLDSELPRGR